MKAASRILLEIADNLNSGTHGDARREFICRSSKVCKLSEAPGPDYFPEAELQVLLQEHGIESMNGTLVDPADPWNIENWDYRRDAMPVRFMFLEFLSYYLEDQE